MKICKTISITIITVLLAGVLAAQKTGPVFLDKSHQNKISAEFLAVSYSYARKLNKSTILGISVMNGFGVHYSPAATPVQLSGEPVSYDLRGWDMELLKLNFFYRSKLSNRIYFDVGPFLSIANIMSDADWVNEFNAGIEISPSIILWKFHLGFSLKGAVSFGDNYSHTYYALYIIPIVIGFGF